MKKLLENAEKKNIAVGAFSVGNMEMVMGAVAAAEELNMPIILQIAECRLKNSPLELMGPMMISAAKNAKVEIAVHLDHGLRIETVQKALEMGFTSVMFDGSTLPLEENIKAVKTVREMADKYGATVEAELPMNDGETLTQQFNIQGYVTIEEDENGGFITITVPRRASFSLIIF
mgnify:CR=1 FL=1